MEARRGAGPAAIAAVLIGLGLALYRPPALPELRSGPRASTPISASAFAAEGARSPASVLAPAADSRRGAADRPATDEAAVWRDALADRTFMTSPGSSASSAYVSGASALREPAADEAPPSAATKPVRPAAARGSSGTPKERGGYFPGGAAGSQAAGPDRILPRRAPLALGPAPVDEEDGGDAGTAVQPGPGRPGPAARSRRGARAFPLFRPPRREERRQTKASARRRVRPLLLSKLLGRGVLRPPPASILPPDLSSLKGRRPLLLPDGAPVPVRPYELERIEAQDPRLAGAPCRRRARHWDDGLLWHDGQARGLIADARWLWLWKEEARWWALRAPEDAPLLRHQGLWWSKQRGVWFALHDGELWSWRRFSDWDAEGLMRLADGVELVYSADFTKVAVITPGAGAVLYDAYSGAELGEWREDELPRRRPRPPAGLRLPRGI